MALGSTCLGKEFSFLVLAEFSVRNEYRQAWPNQLLELFSLLSSFHVYTIFT